MSAGDVVGNVIENELVNNHKIMVPPNARGKLKSLVQEGDYSIPDKIFDLEFEGNTKSYTMSHYWPVRRARPVAEKLPGEKPLLTG